MAKNKENTRKEKKEITLSIEMVETFLGRRYISDLHEISLQEAEFKAEDYTMKYKNNFMKLC